MPAAILSHCAGWTCCLTCLQHATDCVSCFDTSPATITLVWRDGGILTPGLPMLNLRRTSLGQEALNVDDMLNQWLITRTRVTQYR